MYFVILATAATLFTAGQTTIQSAADAAVALEPLAGPAAKVLLAVGLIGAGFLASRAYRLWGVRGGGAPRLEVWLEPQAGSRKAVLRRHRRGQSGGDADQLPRHQPD